MAEPRTAHPAPVTHTRCGSEPDPAWISAHLFHRGSLDGLITGAVAPLIEELTSSGALDGYFFLRYWEGGRHLRVRLLPSSPAHAEHVRTALIQRGTRYLREHPSPLAPATHTAEAYRALAQRMASNERLTGHDARLHPDDTVELIPYRPEYHAYGQRPALSAVETHFTESSIIAAGLLSASAPRAQRHAVALALLMLTLAVCEPDLGRACHHLRGKPPGRVQKLPATDPAARALQEGYRRDRAALHEQARKLWARVRDPNRLALRGPLGAWLHSIRTLHAQLTTAHAQGRFAPADSLSPLSHLGRAVHSPAPAVTQVVLRCTHLLCNRLGIHSTAEAHIASLVTRTLIDLDR